MSSEAPPPPPGDDPQDSPEALLGTGASGDTSEADAATSAMPAWAPADVETVARPSAPFFEEAPVAASVASASGVAAGLPQTDRPQLRSQGVVAGPRRVRLSLARVDPWSVMKLAFLLSVAIGIMIVVSAALVWSVLDSMEVFGKIYDLLVELNVPALLALMDFVEFDSVISIATLIAVLDIVLLTALATIMALLYNITSALVGGVHVTLMDE